MASDDTARTTGEENVPNCPLCSTLDKVARPLVRHLVLRADELTVNWHCPACQATYHFPEPAVDTPVRFGESLLA